MVVKKDCLKSFNLYELGNYSRYRFIKYNNFQEKRGKIIDRMS